MFNKGTDGCCTHVLAPDQSCRVVLLNEGLHLGPDRQVGAHPVHMTPVTAREREVGERVETAGEGT